MAATRCRRGVSEGASQEGPKDCAAGDHASAQPVGVGARTARLYGGAGRASIARYPNLSTLKSPIVNRY